SWINYYSYALTMKHQNTLFINYDDYCKHPNEIMRQIFQKIGINPDLPQFSAYHNRRKVDDTYSPELYNEAMAVYAQLEEVK
ncbi:MAG: hypothetical protein ACQESJ_06775, partial [Bacteroidota bacterium]